MVSDKVVQTLYSPYDSSWTASCERERLCSFVSLTSVRLMTIDRDTAWNTLLHRGPPSKVMSLCMSYVTCTHTHAVLYGFLAWA